LDHFRDCIAEFYGPEKEVKIMLLAGADLIQTMSSPGKQDSVLKLLFFLLGADCMRVILGAFYPSVSVLKTAPNRPQLWASVQRLKVLIRWAGVWSEQDLDHILKKYGSFIVERTGTDIDDALSSLQQYRDNIYIIHQLIMNDVSSTKIRLFLRREMSVQYLIPAPVIEYIEEHGLYIEDGTSSIGGKGKSKDSENSGRASPAIGSSGSKS
jgi:hypothetical protein